MRTAAGRAGARLGVLAAADDFGVPRDYLVSSGFQPGEARAPVEWCGGLALFEYLPDCIVSHLQ